MCTPTSANICLFLITFFKCSLWLLSQCIPEGSFLQAVLKEDASGLCQLRDLHHYWEFGTPLSTLGMPGVHCTKGHRIAGSYEYLSQFRKGGPFTDPLWAVLIILATWALSWSSIRDILSHSQHCLLWKPVTVPTFMQVCGTHHLCVF